MLSFTRYIMILCRHTAFRHMSPKKCFNIRTSVLSARCRSRNMDQETLSYEQLDIMSLSLLRTCRQIYNETSHLFWISSVFVFPTPLYFSEALKNMGPIPSRCITSVRLFTGDIEDYVPSALLKSLDLLTKRSTTAVRRMDLVINHFQVARISQLRPVDNIRPPTTQGCLVEFGMMICSEC